MPYKPGTSYYVTDKDVETAFAQCKACVFVTENGRYKEVLDGTYLNVSDDDTVNAYCATLSDTFRNYLKQNYHVVDWDEYTHILTVTTGMLRWITVIAHVCEYIDRTRKMGEARKMLAFAAERLTQFDAGSDFAQRFIDEFAIQCDGRREEVVRMYGVAILVALIGHEMGHACLGHLYQEQNSLSRNNERCADMFASSVAQSIGNGYAGAVGAVVLDISFIWMQGKNSKYLTDKVKKKVRSTFMSHPVSIDRVKLFLDSFNTVLETSPITGKMLLKLAKQGK